MDQTAYLLEFQDLVDSLPPSSKDSFMQFYGAQMKNPTLAGGLGVFLGVFGVNRFYVGDYLLGVLKLLAGFILMAIGALRVTDPNIENLYFIISMILAHWIVADSFLTISRTRQKNLKIARGIKASLAPATTAQTGE